MHNCAQCNKILSRQTKGDRCLQCYRNRNNTTDTNIHTIDEFPTDHLENSSLNDSNVIPLYDDNEIDNRAVINILKQTMLEERRRDTEFIDILKSQTDFLKDEIINKTNELINS